MKAGIRSFVEAKREPVSAGKRFVPIDPLKKFHASRQSAKLYGWDAQNNTAQPAMNLTQVNVCSSSQLPPGAKIIDVPYDA